jgi:hypothetical protein
MKRDFLDADATKYEEKEVHLASNGKRALP